MAVKIIFIKSLIDLELFQRAFDQDDDLTVDPAWPRYFEEYEEEEDL